MEGPGASNPLSKSAEPRAESGHKSPQLEDGYTRLANAILEGLCRAGLSGQEFRLTIAILRKTYGFRKKEDRISLSQLAVLTGIHRTRCCQVMQQLVTRRIITVTQNLNGVAKKYRFNKALHEWKTVTENLNCLTPVKQTVAENLNHKRNYKRKKIRDVSRDAETRVVIGFFQEEVKERKGFTPELSYARDGACAKRALKAHGPDGTKALIRFYLDGKKSENHLSLSAALSADTFNQYQGAWQKAKWQYGTDEPPADRAWWRGE